MVAVFATRAAGGATLAISRAGITHCRRLGFCGRGWQRRGWKRDVRRCARDCRDGDPCAQCLRLEVCVCHCVVGPVAGCWIGSSCTADGIGAGGLGEGVGVALLAGAAADLAIVAAGVRAAACEGVGEDI